MVGIVMSGKEKTTSMIIDAFWIMVALTVCGWMETIVLAGRTVTGWARIGFPTYPGMSEKVKVCPGPSFCGYHRNWNAYGVGMVRFETKSSVKGVVTVGYPP